jgi:hypothetical protein
MRWISCSRSITTVLSISPQTARATASTDLTLLPWLNADDLRRREFPAELLADCCGAPAFRRDPFDSVVLIVRLVSDYVDHLDQLFTGH